MRTRPRKCKLGIDLIGQNGNIMPPEGRPAHCGGKASIVSIQLPQKISDKVIEILKDFCKLPLLAFLYYRRKIQACDSDLH